MPPPHECFLLFTYSNNFNLSLSSSFVGYSSPHVFSSQGWILPLMSRICLVAALGQGWIHEVIRAIRRKWKLSFALPPLLALNLTWLLLYIRWWSMRLVALSGPSRKISPLLFIVVDQNNSFHGVEIEMVRTKELMELTDVG
ncbi:unnamed protein product [Vicia faba]|uniref:Uncharacterized protein n=1 Tax=Vicia faba TaxID=3906 RepID=A0AAV1AS28_VICFA|nr:unnamed protein product [Vicia faba]